jgi:hypothetical protein
MQSRAEVTSRYARAYMKASKKDKGRGSGRGGVGDRLVA